MTSVLDGEYAVLAGGGDGLRFYQALADAELFVLLEGEPVGGVIRPRVFVVDGASVVLGFDSEERLGGFAVGVVPYIALPGRVLAGQMVGQGLSLGLNLGSGAASEVILPPEVIAWLIEMLDQEEPQAVEAVVAGYEAPAVPEVVLASLPAALAGVARAMLVGVRYGDGRRGQMLALAGVAPDAEGKVARAVVEALAFSGIEAGALDVVFPAMDDPAWGRMTGLALVIGAAGGEGIEEDAPARLGPGMDPLKPPVLR
jgi:hypothetical protein